MVHSENRLHCQIIPFTIKGFSIGMGGNPLTVKGLSFQMLYFHCKSIFFGLEMKLFVVKKREKASEQKSNWSNYYFVNSKFEIFFCNFLRYR